MDKVKQDNFKRIADNRLHKIVDLISKLHNLSNTSFYEFNEIFTIIQDELNKQKQLFDKDKKKGRKRIELWKENKLFEIFSNVDLYRRFNYVW